MKIAFIKDIARLASDEDGFTASDREILQKRWATKLSQEEIRKSFEVFRDLTVSKSERAWLLSWIRPVVNQERLYEFEIKIDRIVGRYGNKIKEDHFISLLKRVKTLVDKEEQLKILWTIARQAKTELGILPYLQDIFKSPSTDSAVASNAFTIAFNLRERWPPWSRNVNIKVIFGLTAMYYCPSLRNDKEFAEELEAEFLLLDDYRKVPLYGYFQEFYTAVTTPMLAYAKNHAARSPRAFWALSPIFKRWPKEEVAEIARSLLKENEPMCPRWASGRRAHRRWRNLACGLLPLIKRASKEGDEKLIAHCNHRYGRITKDERESALSKMREYYRKAFPRWPYPHKVWPKMVWMRNSLCADKEVQKAALALSHNEITYLMGAVPKIPIHPEVRRAYDRLVGEARSLGIRDLGRFHTTALLREIIKNRKNVNWCDSRPLAVVLFSTEDHNLSLRANRLIDLSRRYRVLYYEVSNVQQVRNNIEEATRAQKASLLHFMGHGDGSGIDLDVHNRLDMSNVAVLKNFALRVVENGYVFVSSCRTGKSGLHGSDFTTKLAEVFPHAIVVSPLETTFSAFTFNNDWMVVGIRYFNARGGRARARVIHNFSGASYLFEGRWVDMNVLRRPRKGEILRRESERLRWNLFWDVEGSKKHDIKGQRDKVGIIIGRFDVL